MAFPAVASFKLTRTVRLSQNICVETILQKTKTRKGTILAEESTGKMYINRPGVHFFQADTMM